MRGTDVSRNTQQAVGAAGCWDSCHVSTEHPCVVQRPLWSRKSLWIPGFQLCSSHSFITYQPWPWAGELTLSKAPSPHLLNERESFPCLPHSTAIADALRRHRSCRDESLCLASDFIHLYLLEVKYSVKKKNMDGREKDSTPCLFHARYPAPPAKPQALACQDPKATISVKMELGFPLVLFPYYRLILSYIIIL